MGDITLGCHPACKLKYFSRLNRVVSTELFPIACFCGLLLTHRLVACAYQDSGSHHVWEDCSPNKEYVAFLLHKPGEWYQGAPMHEGVTA